MNIVRQFPLQWPAAWARTPAHKIGARALFNRTTFDAELRALREELGHLGAEGDVIISTMQRTKAGGDVYANDRDPADKGVVVYFVRKGQRQCMPCDLWGSFALNLHAIVLSIKAIRGLERWGSSRVVDAAFAGFNALPAPGRASKRPWRSVLDLDSAARYQSAQIEARFRELAKVYHPDMGGSIEAMSELSQARSDALRELGI